MYLEVLFRLFTNGTIFNISFLYVFLYSLFASILISFLVSLFNCTINKVIYYISIFVISFIYGVQLCIYRMFGFYFDLSLLSATDQVTKFAGDGFKLIIENIIEILLLLLPFILLLVFIKKIIIRKSELKISMMKLISCILVYLVFVGTLYINGDSINSAKELYFNVSNNELNIRKFGVLNAFRIDVKRSVFGFDAKVNIIDDYVDPDDNDGDDEEVEIVYEYNNLDIDFDSLMRQIVQLK